MLVFTLLLSALLIAYVITVLIYYSIKKAYFKIVFINSFMGLGLLFLFKIIEKTLQLNIYINTLTVVSSVVLGPIGVMFNILIDYVII